MSSKDIYKTFHVSPISARTPQGEVLDLKEVLRKLKNDIEIMTTISEWCLLNDDTLLEDIEKFQEENTQSLKSYKMGERIGIGFDYKKILDYQEGTSGKSRFEWMVNERVINEAKSWLTRQEACEGTSTKYISQGYRRTMNINAPCDIKPKMPVTIADEQYSAFLNDPFNDGYIDLMIVINGVKNVLRFDFDPSRFPHAYKLLKPEITITELDTLLFSFYAVHEKIYPNFSSEYVVSIDVGITNYVTLSVVNKHGEIVHSTTLSRRVHSLKNRIDRISKQIRELHELGRGDTDEVRELRAANSQKKEELAIIAGQEIAHVSYIWDNAIVVFEDLSWIANTMQNGRWNRGALVKWAKHFVELNGGRIVKVSAYNTSQDCYKCKHKLLFLNWHDAYCSHCDMYIDRDVNATGNIGRNFTEWVNKDDENVWLKYQETRKNSKSKNRVQVLRTPIPRDVLKYPGRDRTKNSSTPKRKDQELKNKKVVDDRVREVCFNISGIDKHKDDAIVVLDAVDYRNINSRTLERLPVFVNDSSNHVNDCRIIHKN